MRTISYFLPALVFLMAFLIVKITMRISRKRGNEVVADRLLFTYPILLLMIGIFAFIGLLRLETDKREEIQQTEIVETTEDY